MQCEVVLDARAELGEGPAWDAPAGILWWVDIDRREIHWFDPASGSDEAVAVELGVTAAVLRGEGNLLISTTAGIAFAARGDGVAEVEEIEVLEKIPGNRMNDGKCDPAGRYWTGSFTEHGGPATGSLFAIEPDLSVRTMLTEVGCSNGLGWSPDSSTMYFNDSPTQVVQVFDYDPADGRISGRRTMPLRLPSDKAQPDGMAMDAEGNLWIALWDGHAVHCYSPQGALLEVIEVPAKQVTSCAFGGSDLTELYITSAATGLEPAAIESTHAGAMFRAIPGIAGLPVARFAG